MFNVYVISLSVWHFPFTGQVNLKVHKGRNITECMLG